MKVLAAILLSFITFCAQAQTTTPGITQKVFGGDTCLIHIPQGYTPGMLVNVMVGAPGDGETFGPIAKDTLNGSFTTWNGKPGIRDTTVLNPRLVVIWWNPGTNTVIPFHVQTLLTAIKDTFNVYKLAVMGLSLGAQDWENFAYYQKSNFDQINAWFTASAEPANNTPDPTFGGGPIPTTWWALDSTYWHTACATADPDGFFTPMLNTRTAIANSGDVRQPILDSSSSACHCSSVWGPLYSPYVLQRSGMNIYDEFMTQYPIPGLATGLPFCPGLPSNSPGGIPILNSTQRLKP